MMSKEKRNEKKGMSKQVMDGINQFSEPNLWIRTLTSIPMASWRLAAVSKSSPQGNDPHNTDTQRFSVDVAGVKMEQRVEFGA